MPRRVPLSSKIDELSYLESTTVSRATSPCVSFACPNSMNLNSPFIWTTIKFQIQCCSYSFRKSLLKIYQRDFMLSCCSRYQARIFLSYSSQCETSEMRVSIERPHKKQIIMHIHSIMRIHFPPWTRRLILSGSCP